MIIPYQQLPNATLAALLEEYATRDGTDYGDVEVALDTKVQRLQQQLTKGKLVIWFDEPTQSVNLIVAERLQAGHCQ